MKLKLSDTQPRSSNDPVLGWLLDADPSIRWQVMRDLTNTPVAIVAAERSRVASEGWGLRLLDQQRPDGQWGDGVAVPFWWSNMYTLVFLRDLGLDPTSARARTAIDRVRDYVTWGSEFGDSPFFEGEVEPCINGRVVALGAYFGERSDKLVDRLLSEQLEDGGWNCEAERGSVRSSFHTTICVLEGLLAFETAFGASPAVTDARTRAQEYLLERRLLRRLSTGEIIEPAWSQLAFPTLWHYDVLRALDYLQAAGVKPDARVEEAVAIVLERRQDSGRWLLDVRHRNTLREELAGPVGEPNRWITLRARRVLDWHAGSGTKMNAKDSVRIMAQTVTLRHFVPEDAPKAFVMSQEPGMRMWLPDQVYESELGALAVLRSLIENCRDPGNPSLAPYVLAVCLNDSEELIGHVGLSPLDGQTEVGYAIAERHQGRGLASQAVRAMSEWALTRFGLPRILGVVATVNAASCKVLENAGFKLLGESMGKLHGRCGLVRTYEIVR